MNPAADPWIVTQRERGKYLEQFKTLQPQNGIVTGAQAKGFFLQSQLPPLTLGQIWALADTDADGKMDINEFSIACKLINLKLRGFEIPPVLPPSLKASIATVASAPQFTPPNVASPSESLKNIQGNIAPVVKQQPIAAIAGQQLVSTGVVDINQSTQKPVVSQPASIPGIIPSLATAVIPSAGTETAAVLPAPPTPPQSNTPNRSNSLISERAPSIESPGVEWSIKGPVKLKYTQIFNTTDRTRSGFLTGAQARNLMVQTKLPQSILAQIWALSDIDSDGRLGCDEFVLAMYLCDKALAGEKIPVVLPLDMIPPSFRKITSRHASITGSRQSSQPGSRHASISSQGATVEADPLAGLPQNSFEDKRKENFDKGQAELDRRRKLLMDQQKKEQDERERKEREEAEKREKIRIEAERRQQEELERQLQMQRELEIEKEESRKRALEAKETARKELEKQRQLEWENQRISEMQSQRQREQEKVLKYKAQNQALTIELGTFNEKIKELSQKICDTRASVTNVKTVIDGMRSTRDTQMSEMSQLKTKIKEQNQKLLQLTHEKAKWDARAKSNPQSDSNQQEQINFSNKQIILKQLKSKIDNIQLDISSKKDDINSNDIQLIDLKTELKDLIEKCDTLYASYYTDRNKVLEIKNNKKNAAYNSSWDSAPTTWGADTTENPTTTTIDLEGSVSYRALYDFSARNEDELSFLSGDIIQVLLGEHGEPGWFKGVLNEQSGWFPESYVGKVENDNTIENYNYAEQETLYNDNTQQLSEIPVEIPVEFPVEPVEIPAEPTIQATPNAAISTTYNGDVEYFIASYPYESPEAGDLNFNAGEVIMVIKKEGDWWTGTIGDRTGLFPSNYVQKADIGVVYETKDNINGNMQQQTIENIDSPPKSADAIVKSSIALTEESRNQEELDTEVSQINTQQKNVEQSQGSYSRPMSRTSSMTPGMRARKSEIAQVIAPYEATSTEQLSLTRGQLIMIRKKTDSGWWEGELQAKGRRRQIGWFPASYVKVLQGGRNSGRNTPISGSKIEMAETILDKVIALYPYKAQNDDELSFDKDDLISVLGRDEPEWWRGELNGLSGLFPSNYVGPFVSSGKTVST